MRRAREAGQVTRNVVTRVRRLRESRGWSADELARRMSDAGSQWNRDIVANLENDRRTYVSVDELVALADVFGVSADVLLRGGTVDVSLAVDL